MSDRHDRRASLEDRHIKEQQRSFKQQGADVNDRVDGWKLNKQERSGKFQHRNRDGSKSNVRYFNQV